MYVGRLGESIYVTIFIIINFLKYEPSACQQSQSIYTAVFTLGQPLSKRFLFAFLSRRHFILAAKIKPIKVKTDVFDSTKRYHEWLSPHQLYQMAASFCIQNLFGDWENFLVLSCFSQEDRASNALKKVDLSFRKGRVRLWASTHILSKVSFSKVSFLKVSK